MPISIFYSGIECQWEELLLINEDIEHISTGNEIMFFEIIDMQSAGRSKDDFLGIGKNISFLKNNT